MLLSILKISACTLFIYILYFLFLKKEKSFVFIRHFLLTGLIISVLFPILPLEITFEKPSFLSYTAVLPASTTIKKPIAETLMAKDISNENKQSQSSVISPSNKTVPWYLVLYFTGVIFFLIRFLRNLVSMANTIRLSEKVDQPDCILVLLKQQNRIFSFFQYIFIPQNQYKTIDRSIIEHEKAHVIQKHSVDVLLIELVQIFFWFNPVIYFYKRAILMNHEYLADQTVLKKNVDKIEYQKTLLNYFGDSNSPQFTSGFNFKHTKNRIIMIMKTNSKTGRIIKPAISIILSLAVFAAIALQFEESKAMQTDFPSNPIVEGSIGGPENVTINISEPTQDTKKKKTISKDTDLKTLVAHRDSLQKEYEQKIKLAQTETEHELKNLTKEIELKLKQQTLIAEKKLKEKQLELETQLLKKQLELKKKKSITPKDEQAFLLYQNQLELEYRLIEQKLGLEIEFLEDSMANVVAMAEHNAKRKITLMEFEHQQELEKLRWEMKNKVAEMNQEEIR